jgi:hypothetical protein
MAKAGGMSYSMCRGTVLVAARCVGGGMNYGWGFGAAEETMATSCRKRSRTALGVWLSLVSTGLSSPPGAAGEGSDGGAKTWPETLDLEIEMIGRQGGVDLGRVRRFWGGYCLKTGRTPNRGLVASAGGNSRMLLVKPGVEPTRQSSEIASCVLSQRLVAAQ